MAKDKQTRQPRKTRVDSKEEAARTFAAAGKIINPPSDLKLNNQCTMIFSEVIDEFANVDWTPHTIRLAASLAIAMGMLQEAQADLAAMSFVVPNARGNPVPNPLISVTNSLSAQVLAMRRTLALHAISGANKSDVGKRRRIRKDQEDDAPDNEDNLLNTPDH